MRGATTAAAAERPAGELFAVGLALKLPWSCLPYHAQYSAVDNPSKSVSAIFFTVLLIGSPWLQTTCGHQIQLLSHYQTEAQSDVCFGRVCKHSFQFPPHSAAPLSFDQSGTAGLQLRLELCIGQRDCAFHSTQELLVPEHIRIKTLTKRKSDLSKPQ